MIVLLEGSPISTEELWSSIKVTIGFMVTSLTLLPRLLSLARRPALGRVFVVTNLFHLKMMEVTVFLVTLSAAYIFGVPFPRSVPRHHPGLEFYQQVLRPQDLLFALTCTVNCGTLYRQVCAFPNHVQSIEFTTSGIQSSCRNMINGNRMHLSSVSSLKAKGLNTYVNKVFQFFSFIYIFVKMY